MNKIIVTEESSGSRLDTILAASDESTSRSQRQQQIEAGLISVNGGAVKSSTTLQAGDVIIVNQPDESPSLTADLPVIYEDDSVIVINKPHGLLVHPVSKTDTEQTVVGLLGTTLPDDGSERPGVVHRLDRDTSGVMVLAKTNKAHSELKAQFKNRTVNKTYRAVLEGQFEHEQAKIVVPIGRDMSNPSRFKVSPHGKSAETLLIRLGVEADKTYVQLTPRTGRTHQLRVHCQHVGHSIIGDPLYGHTGPRLMLHAHTLEVTVDGKPLELTAPLPQGFDHE